MAGEFKERCEMIHANLQEVSAFARKLYNKGGQSVGIEVLDFARLIETIADELERAIDGQPLRSQDRGYVEVVEEETGEEAFEYGPGRYSFQCMEEIKVT